MKTKLLITLTTAFLFLLPSITFGQTINLGTAANFSLFSTNGAVSNTGITHLTGNVGTNNGSSTGFGNVNGTMHDGNGASAQAAADLLIAYNQLNAAVPNYFPAPLLGNGTILTPGIYSISGATTLNLGLTLDAQNDPNAKFIFQIAGTFSANAESKIYLKNGALACNVFWKVEGMVSLAPGTFMKGTIIANNAAISITTRDTIEGRALSTAGAITIDGGLVYTPTGCSSPYLTGPVAPDLKSTACFSLFSGNGPVTNTGVSTISGSVGTNVGLTTGFDPLLVGGTIRPIPDGVTAQSAADLIDVYNYLNVLPDEIELLYPVQFGRNLVLTPHTYIMKSAAVFTDTLYLNAQGNANAVFVIKINGALSTSTYSKVILINGAQAKNVYWKVEGAVSISNYSIFCGTLVCNGSFNATSGVVINGRALTQTGSLIVAAVTVSTVLPVTCQPTGINTLLDVKTAITIAPNPISNNTTIVINNESNDLNYNLKIYNVLGKEVLNTILSSKTTLLDTKEFKAGIYFYKVMNNNKLIQTGKLISKL